MFKSMSEYSKIVMVAVVMMLTMAIVIPMTAHAEVDSRDISSAFNSLPESERIKIAGQIAQKKEQLAAADLPKAVKEVVVSAKTVKEWAGVGKILGQEIGALVKELAMPIKDFLETGVGQLTVAVILYKIVGAEFASLVFGFVFFVIMLSIWFYLFRRMCIVQSYVEEPTEKTGLLGRVIMKKSVKHFDEDSHGNVNGTRFLMLILLVVLCGISIAVMF